ncbi:MAG: ZIP family metal transporter [Promethearchaeota archaeon]
MSLISNLISYATGTLLAAALIGLIPHALEENDPRLILSFVLGGIILFFVLEKMIIWRHCHERECEIHGTAGPLIIIGDAFHNFIDGIVIAASFLISFPVGLAVSLTVIGHELPQEVGDFAILINSGYSKKKALIYNSLSGASTIPAAIIGYFILASIASLIPFIMAISAASFLYIALSDLTPNLHQKVDLKDNLEQILLILLGIFTIWLILSIEKV